MNEWLPMLFFLNLWNRLLIWNNSSCNGYCTTWCLLPVIEAWTVFVILFHRFFWIFLLKIHLSSIVRITFSSVYSSEFLLNPEFFFQPYSLLSRFWFLKRKPGTESVFWILILPLFWCSQSFLSNDVNGFFFPIIFFLTFLYSQLPLLLASDSTSFCIMEGLSSGSFFFICKSSYYIQLRSISAIHNQSILFDNSAFRCCPESSRHKYWYK